MPIPLFDIDTPRASLRDRLVRAATHTVDEGRFILGPEVAAFEREFADVPRRRSRRRRRQRHRRADDRAARDGRRARRRRRRAGVHVLRVRRGDPTDRRASRSSATSIRETMMVTPETVHAALTPATKAVIAVHLFGNVAPVREIEALGVPVLEDTAQAAGSTGPDGRPGSLGTAATFSFFPSKNLGCLGDGGAIATSREDDRRVRADAALPRLPRPARRGSSSATTRGSTRSRRRSSASSCPSLTAGRGAGAPPRRTTSEPASGSSSRSRSRRPVRAPPGTCTSSAPSTSPRSRRRSSAAEIGNRAYYTRPIHRHPAMVPYVEALELPMTDVLASTHLAIPMNPFLTADQAAEVTRCVERALTQRAA